MITSYQHYVVPFILILMITAAEMATAIYTPSLPTIASHFGISDTLVQWSLTVNLFGLAISGPIYGPWSDCHGRRTALRAGMTLFFIGSAFAWMANTIELLLAARFIQGLGAGAAVVVGFAVVRDLFDEKQSARVMSFMGMAIALSPGLGPVLGSYIAHHHHWSYCFAVVGLIAAVILACLFLALPETLPENKRDKLSVRSICLGYINAMKNIRFLAAAAIPSIMVGAIWAWMAALPVLFITHMDVPMEQFGYYSFAGVMFYVMGAYANTYLIRHASLEGLLRTGLLLCLGSTCLLLIAGHSGMNTPIMLQLINFPFALGLAFIFPNGTALAFSEVKEGMGTSSALLGSIEMAAGALGIYLVGRFFNGTILATAYIMLAGTLISLALYGYLMKSARKEQLA